MYEIPIKYSLIYSSIGHSHLLDEHSGAVAGGSHLPDNIALCQPVIPAWGDKWSKLPIPLLLRLIADRRGELHLQWIVMSVLPVHSWSRYSPVLRVELTSVCIVKLVILIGQGSSISIYSQLYQTHVMRRNHEHPPGYRWVRWALFLVGDIQQR